MTLKFCFTPELIINKHFSRRFFGTMMEICENPLDMTAEHEWKTDIG